MRTAFKNSHNRVPKNISMKCILRSLNFNFKTQKYEEHQTDPKDTGRQNINSLSSVLKLYSDSAASFQPRDF
jgi:hypothetical protein